MHLSFFTFDFVNIFHSGGQIQKNVEDIHCHEGIKVFLLETGMFPPWESNKKRQSRIRYLDVITESAFNDVIVNDF